VKVVDQILDQYDPTKQRSLEQAMARLGILTGYDTTTGQFQNQQTLNSIYEKVTWAYRCIGFIASNLAQLPWKFYKVDAKGNKTDVTDRPEFLIFKTPNKEQTPYDFAFESLVRLLMQGEMFWELDIRGSKLVAIYPDWRSEEVEAVLDAEKGIVGWWRSINGKRKQYTTDQVFMIKYLNPRNIYRGLSPLQVASNAAEMDLDAISFNKNFFKQGARPSGMLTTEKVLTEEQERRLEEKLKRKYQSVDQMHEIMIAWGGLKYEVLNSMSMSDMQLKELRQYNRDEIITTYGLSLEVLGMGEKTYTNVQFYRRMAWTETLIPLGKKIEALINKKFIKFLVRDTSIVMEMDYSGVEALKEDRTIKMGDYSKAFGCGAITPNEIRVDVFGKDPIKDIPEMDKPWIPAMAAPMGEEPAQGEVGPGTNPNEDDATGQEEDNLDEDQKMKQLLNGKEYLTLTIAKRLTRAQRTALWRNRIYRIRKWVPIFKLEIKAFFKKQHRVILEHIDDYLGSRKSGPYDTAYWEKQMADEFEGLFEAALGESANVVLASIAAGATLDITSPVVRSVLNQRVRRFSHFVNSTTDQEIKTRIGQALQDFQEQGIAAQARAVKEVLNDYFEGTYAEQRARLIAQTESVGAMNAGTYIGMVEGGFKYKMWLTSRDDRVRDNHLIDGQIKKVNEPFELIDGTKMDYPQDYYERCVEMPIYGEE
jgi:HK97 family phage portal protein